MLRFLAKPQFTDALVLKMRAVLAVVVLQGSRAAESGPIGGVLAEAESRLGAVVQAKGATVAIYISLG